METVFVCTSFREKWPARICALISIACFSVSTGFLSKDFPWIETSCDSIPAKKPVKRQYSLGSKRVIFSSKSHKKRSATDCTLPALKLGMRITRHKKGEIW